MKGAVADSGGVNLRYIPLTRKNRILRYALLCKLDGPRESWDAHVCAELRKQEEDDRPLIATLEVMFGKGSPHLQIYLLLEAGCDAQAQKELGRWLSAAATATNSRELEAFAEAKESNCPGQSVRSRHWRFCLRVASRRSVIHCRRVPLCMIFWPATA